MRASFLALLHPWSCCSLHACLILSFALPPRIDRVEPAHARGSYPRGLRSCPFYKHKRGSRHSTSAFDSGAESNNRVGVGDGIGLSARMRLSIYLLFALQ